MSIFETIRDSKRKFHTIRDLSEILKLSLHATRVAMSRKAKSGQVLRVKRDLYILSEEFKDFGFKEIYQLANLIKTPSYISYQTALSYYEISTQMPASLFESATPLRPHTFLVQNIRFQYHFCKETFYFGYSKVDGVFIADPEKAFVDALYLMSLGRYALDKAALDLTPLNKNKINKYLQKYPKALKIYLNKWWNENEGF